MPILLCRNICLSFEQRLIKRLVDIIFSVLGIVDASPFMLLSAVAIKLCDRGPFFWQDRCAIDNKVFSICKLRSMVVDSEKDGKSQPAVDNDPCITPVEQGSSPYAAGQAAAVF